MIHHSALFDLSVKHWLENIILWGRFHASQNGFPVSDERVKVLIDTVDIEEILHVIHCAMFGVGGKEGVELHEDLSSSHQSATMSLNFLKSVHLAGKIPFEDIGDCREQLGVKGSKTFRVPEGFFGSGSIPDFSQSGLSDAATMASRVLSRQFR
jgi:hypothetical protein